MIPSGVPHDGFRTQSRPEDLDLNGTCIPTSRRRDSEAQHLPSEFDFDQRRIESGFKRAVNSITINHHRIGHRDRRTVAHFSRDETLDTDCVAFRSRAQGSRERSMSVDHPGL